MLIAATLLWGLSFPLVKSWQAAARDCPGGAVLASLTLLIVRMGLALALLAACRPRLFLAPSRRAHAIGVVIGLVNWVGLVLQVVGLATTTPALSGFLTSLASAWVPVLAFVCFRTSVAGATLAGLGLGIAGAAVLGIHGDTRWAPGGGEGLTLLASVLFAVAIVLLDRLGRTVEAGHLTAGFLAVTGAASLLLAVLWAAGGPGTGAWLAWTATKLRDPLLLRDVGLLTVLCTVLAFHWMNVYQPQLPASRAALIYLLEPVFASVFSLAWGHDQLTRQLVLGGGLILGGNLLVELPVWWRNRKQSLEL
jgi:drug/metabolite transporter (DMT)-like permease